MQIPITLANKNAGESRSLDTIDETVWPSTCFEESKLYGRPENTVDTEQTLSSDRSLLQNISKLAFGSESRVALFRYCTSQLSQYLESVQVGITNGIGSQTNWLRVIGEND